MDERLFFICVCGKRWNCQQGMLCSVCEQERKEKPMALCPKTTNCTMDNGCYHNAVSAVRAFQGEEEGSEKDFNIVSACWEERKP